MAKPPKSTTTPSTTPTPTLPDEFIHKFSFSCTTCNYGSTENQRLATEAEALAICGCPMCSNDGQFHPLVYVLAPEASWYSEAGAPASVSTKRGV